MAGLGFQASAATGAVPKEQASISRHNFTALFAAMRASEHRFDHDRCFGLANTAVCIHAIHDFLTQGLWPTWHPGWPATQPTPQPRFDARRPSA